MLLRKSSVLKTICWMIFSHGIMLCKTLKTVKEEYFLKEAFNFLALFEGTTLYRNQNALWRTQSRVVSPTGTPVSTSIMFKTPLPVDPHSGTEPSVCAAETESLFQAQIQQPTILHMVEAKITQFSTLNVPLTALEPRARLQAALRSTPACCTIKSCDKKVIVSHHLSCARKLFGSPVLAVLEQWPRLSSILQSTQGDCVGLC